MATPLNPDRLEEALRAEGVHVVERAGWRTHNRHHKGASIRYEDAAIREVPVW